MGKTSMYLINSVLLLLVYPVNSIDNTLVAPIGVASANEWQLAAYTTSLSGTIAVRFLPVLPDNMTTCLRETITTYNNTVNNILGPLKSNLDALLSSETYPQTRLIGAVIGSIALGVATSAQITAAVALKQAQDNARNILALKEALSKTNEAVKELSSGLQQTAIALGKIQSFVNEEILPSINQLSCEVTANKLGVYLSLYLTELTTIFGAQLTNPALTSLSYQALYNLCGGNMAMLTQKIGIKQQDVNSLYEAGLITGQVIGYDSQYQLLVIQVNYPSISEVTGVRATELVTVSVTTDKGEGKAIVPQFVAESRVTIEELDVASCKFSSTTLYCRQVNTRALPPLVASCLRGNYDDCQYTTEIGALSSRYITLDGGVLVNCKSIVCRCLNPSKIISQNTNAAVTYVDATICKTIQLDDIQLQLEGSLSSVYARNISIEVSQVTTSGSLDISSEIGNINNTVNRVEDLIHQSEEWLAKVNPHIVNNTTLIVLCVLSALAVIWLAVLTAIIIYLRTKLKTISALAVTNTIQSNPYVNQTKRESKF
nr:fusion protein [Avian metaavulavirus 8]WNH25107.1 fusion protein [Avian metaavulavirus 8]